MCLLLLWILPEHRCYNLSFSIPIFELTFISDMIKLLSLGHIGICTHRTENTYGWLLIIFTYEYLQDKDYKCLISLVILSTYHSAWCMSVPIQDPMDEWKNEWMNDFLTFMFSSTPHYFLTVFSQNENCLISAQTNPGGSISCKIIMQSTSEPNRNDFGLSDVMYFLHHYPLRQCEYSTDRCAKQSRACLTIRESKKVKTFQTVFKWPPPC